MNQRGFTLIEIMVVMGILIALISLGVVVDLNSFKQDTLQSEESKIVSLLERARSQSMANFNGTSHGVCFISGSYVLFQEKDGHCVISVTSNFSTAANNNIAVASQFSDPLKFPTVVFDQLSGSVSTNATINMTDGVKTLTPPITINNEGTISW